MECDGAFTAEGTQGVERSGDGVRLYVGPMRMVVMEYIEGTTEESAWPEDAREKNERVAQKLHEAQLFFRDLGRPTFCLRGAIRSSPISIGLGR